MASNINWTFLNAKLPTEKSSSDNDDDTWKEQRHAIFSRYFDVNNNGYCSLAECDKGLMELLTASNNNDDSNSSSSSNDMSTIVTKPVILRAFTSAKAVAQEMGTTTSSSSSKNNTDNEYIEFSEFRYFLLYIKEYIKLWELFDGIDSNNDRRISYDEFVNQTVPKLTNSNNDTQNSDYGRTLGIISRDNETAATLESIFQSIDTNNGGHILFIELAQYMIQKKMMQD